MTNARSSRLSLYRYYPAYPAHIKESIRIE